MMGSLFRRGSPQTPALMPQVIMEEDDPVPDFFLDDDAGVGSPMTYSTHHRQDQSYYQHSDEWSLKRSLFNFNFRNISPTPSLSEEELSSSSSDCESLSGCSTSPSPAPPETDEALILHSQSKMKKSVKFNDRVEILPFIAEEPWEEAELKPPQITQPRPRKVPVTAAAAGNISVMYGLGRAGGNSPPGNSLVHLHQQEFAKIHGQRTQYAQAQGGTKPDIESYSSDEDEAEKDRKRFFQRTRQYLNQLAPPLPQPLFPPPVWRNQSSNLRNQHPVNQQQQRQQQLEVIREAFSQSQKGRPRSRVDHRAENRYILGETSPTKTSFNLPTMASPPPAIHSPDGVHRQESNFRESAQYNQVPSIQYSYRQHTQDNNSIIHAQTATTQPTWRDGQDVRYDSHDQWERMKLVSPSGRQQKQNDRNGNETGQTGYKFDPRTMEESAERGQQHQHSRTTSTAGAGAGVGSGDKHHQIQIWNDRSRRQMQRERERDRGRPGYRGQRVKDVHRRSR